MRESVKRWSPGNVLLCLALLLFALLPACGGGGGGGDSVPASYDGAIQKAVITADNALDIVTGAWSLGRSGLDFGEAAPLPVAAPAAAGVSPARVEAVLQADVIDTISQTIDSDCPNATGFVLVSGNAYDDGSFDGTMDFSQYCTLIEFEPFYMDGILGFSGQVNLDSGWLTSLRLEFDGFSYSQVPSSYEYAFTEGTISYAFSSSQNSETVTVNAVIRDNGTTKTYWLQNYRMTVDYGVTQDQVRLSGRFYDYDAGYVTISTLTPLTVTDTITGGTLLFTGLFSQARLTFNTDQSTLLEIDANADGVFETSIADPITVN